MDKYGCRFPTPGSLAHARAGLLVVSVLLGLLGALACVHGALR